MMPGLAWLDAQYAQYWRESLPRDPWLQTDAFAAAVGCRSQTICKWIKAGILPAERRSDYRWGYMLQASQIPHARTRLAESLAKRRANVRPPLGPGPG